MIYQIEKLVGRDKKRIFIDTIDIEIYHDDWGQTIETLFARANKYYGQGMGQRESFWKAAKEEYGGKKLTERQIQRAITILNFEFGVKI